MRALDDIGTNGLRMLGTCVGARYARERFPQEKVDHEAVIIAKLINLPHQHALLALRACVQRNLRHLQRSLKSDDLVHLWDKLDGNVREQWPGSEDSTTPPTTWMPRSSPCQSRCAGW
jgi:hypothetical protein